MQILISLLIVFLSLGMVSCLKFEDVYDSDKKDPVSKPNDNNSNNPDDDQTILINIQFILIAPPDSFIEIFSDLDYTQMLSSYDVTDNVKFIVSVNIPEGLASLYLKYSYKNIIKTKVLSVPYLLRNQVSLLTVDLTQYQ